MEPPTVSTTGSTTLSAWANFSATALQQEAKAAQQRAREQQRGGHLQEQLQLPPMTETWKQVKMSDDHNSSSGKRRIVAGTLKSQPVTQSPSVPSPDASKDPSSPTTTQGSGSSSQVAGLKIKGTMKECKPNYTSFLLHSYLLC